MPSKVADYEILTDIIDSYVGESVYDGPDEFRIVEDTLWDTRRWVSVHRIVWLENGEEYYCYFYEKPLTEQQEGSEEDLNLGLISPVTKKTEIKEIVTYV